MENKLKDLKRIKIIKINAGVLFGYESSFGNPSEARERLTQIENKMKTHFSANKKYYQPEENQFVAVNPHGSKEWFRGYVTSRMQTERGIEYRILLIDYAVDETVTCNRLRPLPVNFSTKNLDSQVLKIILHGIIPACLEISITEKSKLRKCDYWSPKDETFVNKYLRKNNDMYFEEISSFEEFKFGILYFKNDQNVIFSLQELMIKYHHAIKCSNFKSEILPYIRRIRRSLLFYDSKLAVRKDLYPSIQFSVSEEENSNIITRRLPEALVDDLDKDYQQLYSDTMSTISDSASKCSENYVTSEIDDLSSKNESYGSNESLNSVHSKESNLSVPTSVKSDFSAKPVDALVDKILVVGRNVENDFQPIRSLINSGVDSKTKEMLDKLNIRDLNRCQKYMIPAMLTEQNVTLIDGPGSGKTLSTLIALISLLRSNNQVPSGVGPRSIVLCPYSSRCEWIQDQCLKMITGKQSGFLYDGDDIRVNVAYSCGTELEKQKLEELIRGYDILICTPRCLLKLLTKEGAFNFRRLSHIVFDEIHILLKTFFKETCEILEHTRRKSKPPQRVVISNYWIPKMKPFTENNLILISSYLDAALFVHLETVWKFISDESKKINSLLDIINTEAKRKNLVILFNDVKDLDYVYEKIQKASSRIIYKITELDFLSLDIGESWKRDARNNRFPVLLCTDYTLSDLHIYEADCLIHYSLPSSKNDFVYRFCVLLEHVETAAIQSLDSKNVTVDTGKRAATFIYSSKENVKQFPVILEIMEKLRAEVPPEIKDGAEKLLKLKELEKRDIEICTNLKQFGRCVNESRCELRHEFIAEKDQPNTKIPKRGYVKIHITHVYSPTHFGARLLEHKTESGSWKPVETYSHPAITVFHMNSFFSEPDNVRGHSPTNLGDTVAVEFPRGSFKRVKVLKLKNYVTRVVKGQEITEPRIATVKFLDEGKITDVSIKELLELPKHLASIPSPIVDIFVCNLLPVDEDITWGEVIRNIIEKKIIDFRETPENVFYGKIQLVLGSNLWLHPFECKQWFPLMKDFVLKFSVSKTLLGEKLAVFNEEHISLLKDKCKSANIVITDESNESVYSSSSRPIVHEASMEIGLTEANNNSLENGKVKSNNFVDTCKNQDDFVNFVFAKPAVPVKKKSSQRNDQTDKIIFKPSVEWRQDGTFVYLTINVNSENFIVDYSTANSIYFRAQIDDKVYEFDEALFARIDIKKSSYYKSGVTIRIKLSKLVKRIKWRRLLKTREQQKWIKFDQNFISDNEEEQSIITKMIEKASSNSVVYVPDKNILNNVCKYPEGSENLQSSSESDYDDFQMGYDE